MSHLREALLVLCVGLLSATTFRPVFGDLWLLATLSLPVPLVFWIHRLDAAETAEPDAAEQNPNTKAVRKAPPGRPEEPLPQPPGGLPLLKSSFFVKKGTSQVYYVGPFFTPSRARLSRKPAAEAFPAFPHPAGFPLQRDARSTDTQLLLTLPKELETLAAVKRGKQFPSTLRVGKRRRVIGFSRGLRKWFSEPG